MADSSLSSVLIASIGSIAASGENFFRFLIALLAFIVVLIATYYVSKWTAGYQKTRMTGGNFEIIDSLRISNNKYLMIVRIGRNKYYSVGVGKDEMVMLGELSEEDVVFRNASSKSAWSQGDRFFSELFASFHNMLEKGDDHEG